MTDEPKYLQFPLFLWRDIFSKREEVINKIFCFGVYWHSKRFGYSLPDVARQAIYGLYNNNLGFKLRKCITALKSDIIGCNEDYRGFTAEGQFDPADEIEELLTAFEMDDNLKAMAVEHYQMHMAFESLAMNGDIEHNLKIGKQIESEMSEIEPKPMLSKALLFEFRDNQKSESDVAQLAAYMAIRSIMGKRQFAKTNKQLIVARMFGFSSHKAIPEQLKPAIKDLMIKYSNRYHIDKLLQQLELKWHVVTYSHHMRGLYVGINIDLDTLALVAEVKKQKHQIEVLKNAKSQARTKALELIQPQLNKGEQLNKDGK